MEKEKLPVFVSLSVAGLLAIGPWSWQAEKFPPLFALQVQKGTYIGPVVQGFVFGLRVKKKISSPHIHRDSCWLHCKDSLCWQSIVLQHQAHKEGSSCRW